MKLPSWLQFRRRAIVVNLAPPEPAGALVAATFDAVAEPDDHALLAEALHALDDQMHDVIDRNADGVNHAAIKLRRETDMLLALGISDPFAAKAGSYAQMALELANAGRGVDLRAQPHNLSPHERAGYVGRAMTLMLRAEILLDHAKKTNVTNIQVALTHQEKVMRGARAALACPQP